MMSEDSVLVEEAAAFDEQIEIRSGRIAELKEALREGPRNVNSEMTLLGELSQEINAVRRLREARFLRSRPQAALEITPVRIDAREGVRIIHSGLM
ncbi:MAG TPA: hypothetical protein VNI02_25750 [Blastocatellia bacterium]|jgi:hypothetical protein|nr:hypothetical protein [Blastocatellia bacterium]